MHRHQIYGKFGVDVYKNTDATSLFMNIDGVQVQPVNAFVRRLHAGEIIG